VRHFFPELHQQINQIRDPRHPEQCRYTQAHLLWQGALLFLMHLGSRKQLRRESHSDAYRKNLKKLCHQHGEDDVADPDTIAYYAERVPPCELEKILAGLTTRMIRMRALDAHRLEGFYTIAIDGTQICTFEEKPWDGAPHRKHKGETESQYFAYVLDAKLVTPSGLALTLATEMITNKGHDAFDKQDCELKALPRLAQKLTTYFPRTRICLLLDSLYANQHVIRLCEENGWKYIIVFKRGSMPERYAEAETLMKMQAGNRQECRAPGLTRQLCWASGLAIEEFTPTVLWCTEQHDGQEEKRFAWLTNFDITRSNAERIANKGGRLRWKIENEGFNTQKNNGYEMEHVYSKHANGFQVFYLFLLLAHYLNQLVLQGNLLESLAETFGSARNFARRLAESIRNAVVAEPLALPAQIRLRPP